MAPEAVKVAVAPRQMLLLGLLIATVGIPELTVIEIFLVVVQLGGAVAVIE